MCCSELTRIQYAGWCIFFLLCTVDKTLITRGKNVGLRIYTSHIILYNLPRFRMIPFVFITRYAVIYMYIHQFTLILVLTSDSYIVFPVMMTSRD